jgi:arylsulfatase A-like enzyme
LFVIDSLRHDYLSFYDLSVGFTPNIERFARDSIVFRNAFTRYGGTGLSVPAIWSGSAILHKQYVMPFDPMNALAKLLSVNSYEQIVSVDSIMERIWTSGSRIQLDRGIPNVDFRFCRTVSELETRLDHIDRPVFAYTLPQDLHIGAVRTATVPAGESYPGRYAPYAARVRQIDACFGGFIDFLQKRGLYDRSLIVLTSDHGELLGEKGRWGHSYYMPPEVVQVPLIIHLPASADKGVVDPDAVALTTDITPTIYAALGYRPIRQTPLRGRTLIGRSAGDAEEQRGDVYVLAASYGAVYAVLRSNGRSLYVANGIKGGDAQYERQGAVWTEREVHDAERSMNEHAIIEHDEAVAREYRLR